MGVLWGLLAAGFIGCADSVTRVTARQLSISVLILITVWLSLAGMLAVIGIPSFDEPERRFALGLSLFSGVLHIVVLFLLFPALARGPVSTAAASASTVVIFLVALNAVAGAAWTPVQLAAAVGVFLGIAMASRPESASPNDYSSGHLRITAALGLSAAVVSAFRVFLIQESATVVGPADSLIAMRMGACVAILPVVAAIRRVRGSLTWPNQKNAVLVLLQAVFETLAFLALLFGSVVASPVGAALGFGAAPVFSTLLAKIWLGDAIGRKRGWWILFVALSVALAVLGAPEQ